MGDWWSEEHNVREYLRMSEDAPVFPWLDYLVPILPEGARILELGMGPGRETGLLSSRYRVTGSDRSPVFLDRYRKEYPDADLLRIDAVEMNIGRREPFDAVVSNKVLIHLDVPDLRRSFESQLRAVKPEGLLCHSFWRGSGEEEIEGLYFRYWESEGLAELVPSGAEVLTFHEYGEESEADSLLMMLRRKSS